MASSIVEEITGAWNSRFNPPLKGDQNGDEPHSFLSNFCVLSELQSNRSDVEMTT